MSAASWKFASSASSWRSRSRTGKLKPTIAFSVSRCIPTITKTRNQFSDVSKTLLDQVEEFFVSYNKQRGKKFRVKGTGGPKKAIDFLKSGIKARKNDKKG